MAVLQNVINTVTVQNEIDGSLSSEFPIGSLASNVAVGELDSDISVQDKIDEYDDFIKNLSTDDVKYKTQTLTDYLSKNVTTDDKSEGIIEQEENDNVKYVTAKNVIEYVQNKTNNEIKSTEDSADNNLITDNAVFQYVNNIEKKIPTAAEGLEETENDKYVTVELFNSKYVKMFDGNLTDDTTDVTTFVNPNQVVTYIKSKVETGAIEENSDKLVTSGTLYTKFAELKIPNKLTLITDETNNEESYATPLAIVNYVKEKTIPIYREILGEDEYTFDFTDLVTDNYSYVSADQVVNYVHTKYAGTIEKIEEEVETGEFNEDGSPIVKVVLKSRKVVHTPIKNIVPEDESTLDTNDVYFKSFVTPKQLVDYVNQMGAAIDFTGVSSAHVSSGAVGTEFNNLNNVLGYVRDSATGLYNEPVSPADNTLLARIKALEEAVKLNTTTTN